MTALNEDRWLLGQFLRELVKVKAPLRPKELTVLEQQYPGEYEATEVDLAKRGIPDEYLVQVPAPLRKRPMMKASFSDRGRKHRTEPVPPKPYRLVADVDAPLEQNILDLSQRQRIADIHHHREPDHLGRAVEITEGIAHRPRLGMSPARLKPIYSDDAPHRLG